jgi:hypothetical protein
MLARARHVLIVSVLGPAFRSNYRGMSLRFALARLHHSIWDNPGCSSLVPRALQARASWPGSPSRVWSIVPYPLRFPPAVST